MPCGLSSCVKLEHTGSSFLRESWLLRLTHVARLLFYRRPTGRWMHICDAYEWRLRQPTAKVSFFPSYFVLQRGNPNLDIATFRSNSNPGFVSIVCFICLGYRVFSLGRGESCIQKRKVWCFLGDAAYYLMKFIHINPANSFTY